MSKVPRKLASGIRDKSGSLICTCEAGEPRLDPDEWPMGKLVILPDGTFAHCEVCKSKISQYWKCGGCNLCESCYPHSCGQAERDSQLLAVCDDPGTIFYGPHPCENCKRQICRASREQGGMAFDYPEGIIYPNSNWVQHLCLGCAAPAEPLTAEQFWEGKPRIIDRHLFPGGPWVRKSDAEAFARQVRQRDAERIESLDWLIERYLGEISTLTAEREALKRERGHYRRYFCSNHNPLEESPVDLEDRICCLLCETERAEAALREAANILGNHSSELLIGYKNNDTRPMLKAADAIDKAMTILALKEEPR